MACASEVMKKPSQLLDTQIWLSSNHSDRQAMECIICQEEFTRDALVCQLPCHVKHVFHAECIKPWIRHKSNSCPLCKEKLPVERHQVMQEVF